MAPGHVKWIVDGAQIDRALNFLSPVALLLLSATKVVIMRKVELLISDKQRELNGIGTANATLGINLLYFHFENKK